MFTLKHYLLSPLVRYFFNKGSPQEKKKKTTQLRSYLNYYIESINRIKISRVFLLGKNKKNQPSELVPKYEPPREGGSNGWCLNVYPVRLDCWLIMDSCLGG